MFNVTNSPSDGFVWFVGAGPGAADLITVRGRDVLAGAEVVIHDELAGTELLGWCRPDCVFHAVGKRAGQHGFSQEAINRLIVDEASRGRRVVRLKGGDPTVFGRLGEELAALRAADIAFEIVPGVTAACAAAAAAGVSLTHRSHASAAVFVTGHECVKSDADRIDWPALARPGLTLCVYMGVRRFAAAAGQLIAAGLAPSTPVRIVSHISQPGQRIADGTLADAEALTADLAGQPALILVGEAVQSVSTHAAAELERSAVAALH